MDCIFNATFFQPLFKKIKMLKKKKKKKKSTRGFVVADPVCEGWRWAQQKFCVTQQGHLATSSLLGLQLQHSKPPKIGRAHV